MAKFLSRYLTIHTLVDRRPTLFLHMSLFPTFPANLIPDLTIKRTIYPIFPFERMLASIHPTLIQKYLPNFIRNLSYNIFEFLTYLTCSCLPDPFPNNPKTIVKLFLGHLPYQIFPIYRLSQLLIPHFHRYIIQHNPKSSPFHIFRGPVRVCLNHLLYHLYLLLTPRLN